MGCVIHESSPDNARSDVSLSQVNHFGGQSDSFDRVNWQRGEPVADIRRRIDQFLENNGAYKNFDAPVPDKLKEAT